MYALIKMTHVLLVKKNVFQIPKNIPLIVYEDLKTYLLLFMKSE